MPERGQDRQPPCSRCSVRRRGHGVSGSAPLGGEQALGLLATMWRIRLFEERVGRLTRGRRGPRPRSTSASGQEGVAAAVCSQLRDDDAVYSGHRAHGHAIAKGAPLDASMAELMGRDDGPLSRARRLDAPRRRRARVHGRDRRRRRQHPDRPRAARSRRGCAATTPSRSCSSATARSRAGIFNETVNLATLWEAAADPRVREQRLRRVHAALGAHERRARERRRRALRASSGDRRRRRRRARSGTRSAATSPRRAQAAARFCSSA